MHHTITTMNHLELFSGTFSFGKITSQYYDKIVSLDRDIGDTCPLKSGYKSRHHHQDDILKWDYKQYPKHHFHLITASPCCVYWSRLRQCNIGRKMKNSNQIYTREMIDNDILEIGIPMIDKVFEIMDYFQPNYYIIENPYTGRMKEYINDLIPLYVVDYCRYGFDYRKRTIFWTNIEGFESKLCQCESKKHAAYVSQSGGGSNRLPRYRIPLSLIDGLDVLTL